ncbi:MAG: hypothetical protein E7385_00530 [Ruminococcaceae bacterium]|nr:hypothetical protein [Oscillospiraceae bacterium]
MRKRKFSQETPKKIKSKLIAAVTMLLISCVLVTIAGYAWLTMSIAPEVTGVKTNIGSNGSLEIALLNAKTRQDLTQIKTAVGQSLVNNKVTANNTWGNIIDLNDSSYGLDNIVLLPSRLNTVKKIGGGYTVNTGMLSVPTYGYDGRIIDLTDNTFSAVFNKSAFSYSSIQQYGVRAIGTADTLSVRESAIAMAKSNIRTYTNSANSSSSGVLKRRGMDLLNLIVTHATNSNATYDDSDLEILNDMISSLQNSADYIDLAIRQALVAYAASLADSEEAFISIRNQIVDNDKKLDSIIDSIDVTLPDTFNSKWVDKLNDLQNKLNEANNQLNQLDGGEYTWSDIRGVLDKLINLDEAYIGEKKFSNCTSAELIEIAQDDFTITLSTGSGVFADISDFAGDFSSSVKYLGAEVTIRTLSQVDPMYLQVISELVNKLSASNSGAEDAYKITSTYGYAIDLAFRCNAPISDLLLQTEAMQRIYEDSVSPSTMGGGSYMEFVRTDTDFTVEQSTKLMDALRVGFIDDQGNILCVAKLNVSNRVVDKNTIKAPLYIYDYSISEEEEDKGAMIIGERRKFDNKIVALEQNVAKAVTVLVWLDGDIVDNTMVSAESETSLNGTLNLQFASSADLIPADNNGLINLTTNTNDLIATIESYKETYKAGQKMYTTISWNAFTDAYEHAMAVVENKNSNDSQVYMANKHLKVAKQSLEEINITALKNEAERIRTMMGTSEDIARYVLFDEEKDIFISTDEYTQADKENSVATIYRVNYSNNLREEGNGVKSTIYTDESWSALAAALYDAESIIQYQTAANFIRIDNAMTALDLAYKALERKVFYIPYEYEGDLYYFAISSEDDTYGKWYDANFKMIVSDLRVLELDARAEVAEIAYIDQFEYIENISSIITPVVKIKTELYSSLKNEEILAVHWNCGDKLILSMDNKQKSYIEALINNAKELGIDSELYADAQALLTRGNDNILSTPSRDEANLAIIDLEKLIKEAQNELNALNLTNDEMKEVMKSAINKLKAIEGYSETDATFTDVVNVVNDAEEYILRTNNFKLLEAYKLLIQLNDQLKENNLDPVELYDYKKMTDKQRAMINNAIERANTILDKNTTDPDIDGEETDTKLVALENAITKAENDLKTELSEKSAQLLLDELNKNIVDCGGSAVTEDSVDTITEEQRAVLLKAVNNAKTIEGWDSEPVDGVDSFEKLKKLIKDSEDILSSETGNNSTKEYVQSLIDGINVFLVDNGMKAVNEYNTIVHKLPMGSEILNVTNFVDFATAIMHPSGTVGKTMIGAVVLTKSGVVLNVNKEITVYEAIDSAKISTDSEKANDFKVNDTLDYTVSLKQKQIPYIDQLGNVLCFVMNNSGSGKEYMALFKIDTENKTVINSDGNGDIVYENSAKVYDTEEYLITISDGKLNISKAQVDGNGDYIRDNSQNIIYQVIAEETCDELLYVDNNLNLYYKQGENIVCINPDGNKLIDSKVYLVDNQYSGYIIAQNYKNLIKSVYYTGEDQEEIHVGYININNFDSWVSGQIYEVTNSTEVGENIDHSVWSTSNINVFKIVDDGYNSCKIQGIGVGQAYLSVTVYTKQGNNYTVSYLVTVNPAKDINEDNVTE